MRLFPGPLDFETQDTYILTVLVKDGGSPSLSTSINIYISVEDVNNGPPSFNDSFTISVAEDAVIGSSIYTFTASDPDGENSVFGNIYYFIISGDAKNQFMLDYMSGTLFIRSCLDREDIKSYSLVVQAKESGGDKSATTVLAINVTDVNDNVPSCEYLTFTSKVNESGTEIGAILHTLNCTDADEDILTYTITAGDTTKFHMSTDNLQLKAPLNFEDQTLYDVSISVSDGKYSTTVTGRIRVQDLNEAAPMFKAGRNKVIHLSNIRVQWIHITTRIFSETSMHWLKGIFLKLHCAYVVQCRFL